MKVSSLKSTIMLFLLCCAVVVTGALMGGCAGSDGAAGATGSSGAPGTPGTDQTAGAKAETCVLCHADAFAPPTEIHPNVPANIDTAPYTATIDSVLVTSGSGSTVFTINFTVLSNGAYVPTLADRAAPSATGTASSNLAYLRFAYAKLTSNPSVTVSGDTKWTSYNQGERAYANLTSFGSGTYTYVCSKLTSTGIDAYDATATTRIALQISTAAGITSKPLQITYDFRPDGNPITVTRDVVATTACAECHGTRNGIAHGTRYETKYCAVCHTLETMRNGETVNFKQMVHQIHTSQTRSFLDSAELTYPQDILNCVKCHRGSTEGDNWKTKASIEACGSCHYNTVFTGSVPAGKSLHMGGDISGATTCYSVGTCHDTTVTNKRNPAVAHMTINASPNNPSVPAGDVNFAYEISGVKLDSTSTTTSTKAIITFRILAKENATPTAADFVTLATYTTATGASMVTVGTHTFSGGPSFLVAYALPQEGLTNNAATMNDFNNFGKAAAQPASVSLATLWSSASGTITGPAAGGWYTATISSTSGKFPAGAKMRTVALQGYFTQVDSGDARHTLSVTGTVSGDTVRRAVIDPAKCANCHEWFEGHGGNRVIGSASTGVNVCVLCHVPNLSSSGRGADPATVLSRIAIGDPTGATPAKMTAAGYNPADPSTYPEESQNFKDLIHAIHASALRTAPFRFVRDRGTSGVFYYDMSEVTFPGRIGDCETCHKPGTYNLPTNPGLLSSTNETTDGNAATSVTADRSTLPNASDLVTPPSTAACITCHDTNVPVTHINAQGGSSKVKRSDALR